MLVHGLHQWELLGCCPRNCVFTMSSDVAYAHYSLENLFFFPRASETWQDFDNSLSGLFHVLQVNVKLCYKECLGKKSPGERR